MPNGFGLNLDSRLAIRDDLDRTRGPIIGTVLEVMEDIELATFGASIVIPEVLSLLRGERRGAIRRSAWRSGDILRGLGASWRSPGAIHSHPGLKLANPGVYFSLDSLGLDFVLLADEIVLQSGFLNEILQFHVLDARETSDTSSEKREHVGIKDVDERRI